VADDDIRELLESVQDYFVRGGLDEDARYYLGPDVYGGLSRLASLGNFIGPGADVTDVASESAKVMEGDPAAFVGLPAALAMMALPGSKSGVEEVAEKSRVSIFPKPERMFDEGNRPRGGEYINPETQDVLTGKNISSANISVKEGKPSFTGVADNPPEVGTSGKGTYKTKINLYRKGLWKWIDPPKDYSDISTLVSVVQKDNKHYFALEADLPSGVNLARYPNAPTEPRLRPTVQAQPLELGNIVGTIRVQGKERPVYDKIVAKAAGGLVQRNPYNYEPKAI